MTDPLGNPNDAKGMTTMVPVHTKSQTHSFRLKRMRIYMSYDTTVSCRINQATILPNTQQISQSPPCRHSQVIWTGSGTCMGQCLSCK